MSGREVYAQKISEALAAMKQRKAEARRERAAKAKNMASTATMARRPATKEERLLRAAEKRASIQIGQLAAGRCVQSPSYSTKRR